jgi:hypothetical protein
MSSGMPATALVALLCALASTLAADGLSASMRDGLLAGLGPHAAAVVSAERLVIDLLEPRLPEERTHFVEAARVTRGLWEEAFSRQVITPGKTTVGDVLWHVRQRMADLHVGTWFRPDLRVQRRGAPAPRSTPPPGSAPGPRGRRP